MSRLTKISLFRAGEDPLPTKYQHKHSEDDRHGHGEDGDRERSRADVHAGHAGEYPIHESEHRLRTGPSRRREEAPAGGTVAVSFTPTIPSSSTSMAPATEESASFTIREPAETLARADVILKMTPGSAARRRPPPPGRALTSEGRHLADDYGGGSVPGCLTFCPVYSQPRSRPRYW